MMRKPIIFGLMSFVFLSLSGCIQFDTVIKVKPNGSGFIEETFLMRKDFLRQMQALSENMAKEMGHTTMADKKEAKGQVGKDAQAKIRSSDFFDEAKLKERTRELGEGVTYVSSSKIDSRDYEGFKATYAFTDINKVRIKQDVKGKMPSASAPEEAHPKKKQQDITFLFTKGNPAELVVKLPTDQIPVKTEAGVPDKGLAPAGEQPTEEMKAFVMKMFEGMKMGLSVEVAGTIIDTNATYRDGSKIALLEVDFGKLVSRPEGLRKFSEFYPENLEEIRKLMRDFPGIKVELNNEVRITFR
jgi:hypothetical protein